MFEVDLIVIGAGVCGLACAELLSKGAGSVLVLERHASHGRETSARNSGVLHAGIYYPPSSRKAQLCLRGRSLLQDRAKSGELELRITGKLIVATHERELGHLEELRQNARSCGVDLAPLEAGEVTELEPTVRAAAGLLSLESGIVDVDGFLSSLKRNAMTNGATFAFRSEVTKLEQRPGGWRTTIRGPDGSRTHLTSRWVINAAGLDADRMAQLAGLDVDELGYRQYPCKGSYFLLGPRAPKPRRLIYPLPDQAGLGVHLTLDLAGNVRAGPDAEYVTSMDSAVDEAKRHHFWSAVQRYLPGLREDDLHADYAGFRPKLAAPGAGFRDFVVSHEAPRGLPGLVNLLGIESPGLTASLAIGEAVLGIVRDEC